MTVFGYSEGVLKNPFLGCGGKRSATPLFCKGTSVARPRRNSGHPFSIRVFRGFRSSSVWVYASPLQCSLIFSQRHQGTKGGLVRSNDPPNPQSRVSADGFGAASSFFVPWCLRERKMNSASLRSLSAETPASRSAFAPFAGFVVPPSGFMRRPFRVL